MRMSPMKLFEPGQIGELVVKNRIVMAPMHTGGLVEPSGRLSEQGIDYFETRAKGGAGLIIVSCARVNRYIEQLPEIPYSRTLMIDNNIYVGRLTQLAEAIHDHGAKMAIQLTAGIGRVSRPAYIRKGDCVSASKVPLFFDSNAMARELTIEEIEKIVQSFEPAAERIKAAEIDAIELHGHEGYLFDQFKTALWNRRTDKYGGDLEGRLRFSLEIIDSIKRGAGKDFPIIYRYGLTHYLEGGREIEEGLEIARKLEAAGVAALDIDAGCYENWYWAHPPTTQPMGCMVNLAEAVKKVVKIPVMAVGKLGAPVLAEKVLREGKADFIMLGRALLADPEWPKKVRNERSEEIRPCIGDHACLQREILGKNIGCTVNPAAGIEKQLTIHSAETKHFVLVVGGGPGGMEAARTAALRGHKVTLWEKGDTLGGNLIPAAAPSFKKEYKEFLHYLSRQIQKVGVSIELLKTATPELVKGAKPDVLFLATGARPIIPDIPGVKGRNVVTALDVLSGKRDTGKSTVIVGGGVVGCETALHLARNGKKITIVEITDLVLRDLYSANRMHLLKLLNDANVEILTHATVLRMDDDQLVITGKEGKKRRLLTDAIVLSVGMKSSCELLEPLKDDISEIYCIGDCVKPRNIMSAIWEGYRFARQL